jgi:hypothetical protein
MAKGHKLISLDPDVFQDILFRHQKYGFDFSNWVNREYRNQFMEKNNITARIEKRKSQIQEDEELLARINEVRKAYEFVTLSRDEKRYLQSVPKRLAEGCNKKSVWEAFNNIYHRQVSQEQFYQLVEHWSKENDRS